MAELRVLYEVVDKTGQFYFQLLSLQLQGCNRKNAHSVAKLLAMKVGYF